MFVPNNDVKIVCKLEKDDGNTIRITDVQQRTHDYTKVKLTTLASNISIKDIFHFSPSFIHHSDTQLGPGLVYFPYIGGSYQHTFDSSVSSSVNFNYIPYYGSISKKSLYDENTNTYFDYEKFVLSNGKVIDLYRYQLLGNSNPCLSLRASSQRIENTPSSTQAIEIIDVYDNSPDTLQKIGTLPISYPYFDTQENKVKIISFDNEAKMVLLDTPSQYFALASKDGNQYGYFSDENGNPSEYDNSVIQHDFLDKFPVNCTVLDLVQLAKIEEDVQKTLELEKSDHSAALNSAQVKNKAISAIVNRTKRQVEEDATGEIVDEVKNEVKQKAAYQTAQSIINPNYGLENNRKAKEIG